VRGLLIELIGFIGLWLAVVVLPGIRATGWVAILLAQGILVLLNVVIWPVVVDRATWLLVWTAGLAALACNAGSATARGVAHRRLFGQLLVVCPGGVARDHSSDGRHRVDSRD
jgi:hypothetical protein